VPTKAPTVTSTFGVQASIDVDRQQIAVLDVHAEVPHGLLNPKFVDAVRSNDAKFNPETNIEDLPESG